MARIIRSREAGWSSEHELYEKMIEFVLEHRQEFAEHLGIEVSDE
jgi:hypothetical protein